MARLTAVNVWTLVAVFASGVVLGMILAFLAAIVYTIEDPRLLRRTQPGMDDDR